MEVSIVSGPPSVEWCDVCQLPSVITFEMYSLNDDGVWPFATFRRCADHEGE